MRLPPADCHTHPQGLRRQVYRETLLAEWIQSARHLGLSEIVFTDFAAFADAVDPEMARDLSDDRLTVGCGLELDNAPGNAPTRGAVAAMRDRLDLVLGVVNHLGNWPFARAESREEFCRRDPDRLFAAYYHELRLLIATGLVDCIAQFDLIRIHGAQPSEDFTAEIRELLGVMKDSGLALMICSSGWDHPVRMPFPGPDILREAVRMGVTITLGSDARAFDQLARNYEHLRMTLHQAGVSRVAVLRRHAPVFIDLPPAQTPSNPA